MRTNVVIDEQLISEAMRVTGMPTKRNDTTMDNHEALADNRHSWIEVTPNAMTLPAEVRGVRLLPVFKRTVAFSFSGCELCGNLIEWNDVYALRLDDTERHLVPVCHHAQITDLGQWDRRILEGPHKPGGGALHASQDQLCKLIGARFVIIKMERLEEPRSRVLCLGNNERLPIRIDVVGDLHLAPNFHRTPARPPAVS